MNQNRNMPTERVENTFGGGQQRQVTPRASTEVAVSRVQQEVQGMIVCAKKFPRDERSCVDKILMACTRQTLAEGALYEYQRGGSAVRGPSIRLAEAIAQSWTNIEFGLRELSRGAGDDGVTFSEVEAFAWDIENNTRRAIQFYVRHWRDTRAGGYQLVDERDIYELVANQGARRVRACILAVIPGDAIEMAVNQCQKTLEAHVETSPDAIKKIVDAFGEFGVTAKMIEKRLGRRIDTITPGAVVQLRGIYASLRDGMSTAADWFQKEGDDGGKTSFDEAHAKAAEKAADKKGGKAAANKAAEKPGDGQAKQDKGAEQDKSAAESDGPDDITEDEKQEARRRELEEAGNGLNME